MNALAPEISRITYVIVKKTYSFFRTIGRLYIKSRQRKADHEIAKVIHASREFRGESFEYILNTVSEGRAYEIFSK